MRLFKIDFAYRPASPESIIILAESKEEALKSKSVLIYLSADWGEKIVKVTEIDMTEAQEVYCGHNCC